MTKSDEARAQEVLAAAEEDVKTKERELHDAKAAHANALAHVQSFRYAREGALQAKGEQEMRDRRLAAQRAERDRQVGVIDSEISRLRNDLARVVDEMPEMARAIQAGDTSAHERIDRLSRRRTELLAAV